jgi:peptidoglycan/LPS O-acetylase OafA/YrhL
VASSRLPYVPALDGLRGLAIAAVLAFHAGYLPGGFLGVDLFFVLSGFLITSLLLAEHRATGRIDLLAFWAGRARRLLPALLAMLVAVVAVVGLAGDAPLRATVRGDALATLGYVANWREVVAGQSYWNLFAEPSPLDHTWSLAIEEQFYVLWPLVVLAVLVWGRTSRRALLLVIAGLGVASAVATAVLHRPLIDPSRVYFGTDTRAAAILIGAALAAAMTGGWPSVSGRRVGLVDAGAVAALGGILAVWAVADAASGWLYEGGLVALELVAAVVIFAAVRRGSGPVARLLGSAPLRALGIVSYGLYLWHWPIFVLLSPGRTGLDGAGLAVLRLGATLLVAVASYIWLEQPIRQGAIHTRRLVALAPASMAAVVVMIVLTTVGRVPAERPAAAATTAPSAAGPHLQVLLAGDSTAVVAAVEFDKAEHRDLAVSHSARLGCGIAPGRSISRGIGILSDCAGVRDDYRRAIEQRRPGVVVLMTGAWEVLNRVVDEEVVPFQSERGRSLLLASVTGYVDDAVAVGARVALVAAPCFAAAEDARMPTDERNDPERVAAYNAILEEVAAARTGSVTLLDYSAVVCEDGRPTEALIDGVHLSERGAVAFWSWLAPRLHQLAG